jgi:thioredoxin 2
MSKALIQCQKCRAFNRVDLQRSGQPKCGACKIAIEVHSGINEVSLHSLQDLLASSPVPVVVDFWAPWCGPCRAFAPTFAAVSERRAGEFVFAKLNTEEHQAAGSVFNIRGIPTIVVFSKGKELTRQSGAMDPRSFEGFLNDTLRSA